MAQTPHDLVGLCMRLQDRTPARLTSSWTRKLDEQILRLPLPFWSTSKEMGLSGKVSRTVEQE